MQAVAIGKMMASANGSAIAESPPSSPGPGLLPRWLVDIGHGDQLGLATDDGCFVVLYPKGDSWRTGKWIPKQVAEKISELLQAGVLG